jgi:hypothetical protein
MKAFKKIILFFSDLRVAKINHFYTGEKSSYGIIRFLYFISDGLLLKFLESWLFKKNPISLIFHSKPTFKNLPKVNDKSVNDIKKQLFKMRVFTKNKQQSSLRFLNRNFQDLNSLDFDFYKKDNVVRLDFDNNQIIQNKFIVNFINTFLNKKLIKIIKEFSGFDPLLLGVNSWLTLPIPNENKIKKLSNDNYDIMTNYYDAQQWHRDCDNFQDIKIFIYLSNVNSEDDGCFQIINGTNNFSFFSPFKYKRLSSLRISQNIAIDNFAKKIYSFYGTKGKNFLANTRALHRGLAINKSRARLMLELYFSNHLLGKNRKLDLKKNHSSYKLWNKMINENPKLYQGIFTERTINSFLI